MTCKERLALEHPDRIVDGRPLACPSDYGYLPDPVGSYGASCVGLSCIKCWERETSCTQFDKIKSFNLEQMAEFLLEHANCACCSRKEFEMCTDVGDCKTHIMEYLTREV